MGYRDILFRVISSGQLLFKWGNSRTVRVLAYHDITDVDLFEKQIQYIKGNYNVIAIHDLEDHVYYQKPLPPYPVLITFDDGDISMYTYGLPVFKKYEIPAVIFIITGLINTPNPFWWKLVQAYHAFKGEPHLGRISVNKLKSVSNEERVSFINKIKGEMPDLQQEQLTSDQIQEMADHNIVLANHSHSHPIFDKISDQEFIDELTQAREFYKRERVEGYEWFAYPNGNSDVSKEGKFKEMGIKLCFLFDHKINKRKIHPFRISRIRVNSYDSMAEFKVRVSGAHSFIMRK